MVFFHLTNGMDLKAKVRIAKVTFTGKPQLNKLSAKQIQITESKLVKITFDFTFLYCV